MIKAGIIGSTGYAGAEIARLLLGHKDAKIVWLGSKSYIDKPYSSVYGNMFRMIDDVCRDDNISDLAKEADIPVATLAEMVEAVRQLGRKGLHIQRYKGLGEMNPKQLFETTMDPKTRRMLKVRLEDVAEAEQTFSMLMGDDVPTRRTFIEDNALNVANLDI